MRLVDGPIHILYSEFNTTTVLPLNQEKVFSLIRFYVCHIKVQYKFCFYPMNWLSDINTQCLSSLPLPHGDEALYI